MAGLATSYGSGAMSNSMDDVLQSAGAFFIIGSNTTEQHPVFGAKLRGAVRQRNVPLVVADPRKIDITECATLHLRHRPGTDVALVNGLMYIMLEKGLPIHARMLEGEWLDTGDKFNFLKATIHYGLKHPEIGDRLKAYLKQLPLS